MADANYQLTAPQWNFDLKNHFLVIPKAPDQQGDQTEQEVEALIQEGEGADGLWDGTTGLYSSTAAKVDRIVGKPLMGIACADAADLGLSPGDNYDGVTIPAIGAVIARYAYLGATQTGGSTQPPSLRGQSPAFVLTASGTIDTAHANGLLEPDGSFEYVPKDDYTGQDSFSYTATNQATGSSSTGTVTVSIQDVAPVVGITDVPGGEVPANMPVTLGSSVIQPGIGETFTYAWDVTKVSDGATTEDFATGTDQDFTFTPDGTGTYTVQLAVTDAAGETGTTQAVIQDSTIILSWSPQNSGDTTWSTNSNDKNWKNSQNVQVAWDDSDSVCADFPSVSSGYNNVTVSGTVHPGSMSFDVSNYSISGGTVSLSSTSTTNITVSTGTATICSAVSCSSANGGITKLGSGTLWLSGGNSNYSGSTSINGGVLEFSSGALGTSGSISFGGGTFQWSHGNTQDIGSRLASISGGQTAALDPNGNNPVALTLSGLSGSGGGLTVGTSGGSGGTLVLTGSASYTGVTNILSGGSGYSYTLQLGNGSTNCNLGGSSGGGGINIAYGASVLFAPGSSQTYSGGNIYGSGSLALSGGGGVTLTLNSGGNTYSGSTTISGGTLKVGGSWALPNGTTVSLANNSAATLNLNNYNQTIGGLSGGGNVTLGSATLTVNMCSLVSYTYAGNISGGGGLTVTSSGIPAGSGGSSGGSGGINTLILTGSNS